MTAVLTNNSGLFSALADSGLNRPVVQGAAGVFANLAEWAFKAAKPLK